VTPLDLARRRSGGFTLLEVMVALGLLAAALMALADLVGNALRNHTYARDLSAATLLARGKMAELEQKYEDLGFTDFDQDEDGDFADAQRPDVHWHLELVRPSTDFSADQLVSMLAGAGVDPQDLVTKIMGGGAGGPGTSSGADGGTPGAGPSQPTTSAGANPAVGALTKMIQTQLTAFGETLKQSFREMRLTVSWRDGKTPRAFTVTTHLVVLNPRAPGGARGDNPEVPPNLVGMSAAGAGALPGMPGAGVTGVPGMPGVPGAPGGGLLGTSPLPIVNPRLGVGQ
jgi:general secretion pathway protein I